MTARADLEALARRGIGWVADNRQRFDPGAPGTRPGSQGDKALVELAVMARRLTEAPAGHDEMAGIRELLEDVLAGPRYQERSIRSRSDAVATAFLLGAVDKASDAARSPRRMLQRIVDAGVLDGLERPVHRVMEERLALEWAGVSHSLPAWEELMAGSLLAATPNAVFLGKAAAYQLTHIVLYLTGFGSRAPARAVHGVEEQRQRFTTLIVRFALREHWDLVAELLLSWACLGLGPSGTCDGAWQRLLGQVAPDGSLHAISGESDSAPGCEQWFHDRYHTTLVAVMAAETWLLRGAGTLPSHRAGAAARDVAATTELAREVAAAEVDWLASRLDDGREQHVRTPCSVLVGIWICGALSPAAGERLAAVAAPVAAALDGDHQWTELPAALAFVAYGILARRELAPDGLRRYVTAAAGALADSPPDDLSLDEARRLLHRLGLVAAPPGAPAEALLQAAQRVASDPTDGNAQQLLLTAESRTAYGAAPPCGPSWVGELLFGLAVNRARADDLVAAGRATRAAVHVGGGRASAAYELARYMACRQRPEDAHGSAGSRHDEAGDGEESLAARLAGSLSVVWTLAEVTTDWRLATAL